MQDHPTTSELELLVEGRLEEGEAARVRSHLAVCAECRDRHDQGYVDRVFADEIREAFRGGGPADGTAIEADRPSARGTFPFSGVVEGYELIEELHRGGQGIVYRALQNSTKREVAIKILPEGPYASPSARKRFEREIDIIAQFRHPNVITIFDTGETADRHLYYVMDYIPGVSIVRHAREQSLSVSQSLRLFCRVCDAVNYAHQQGVIHRDLKPSNILVGTDGVPKVLDFGLAKAEPRHSETLISIPGRIIGTLPYISPEHALGKTDQIDSRSDVYALGVILFEMLAGTHPYPTEGVLADVLRHIAETPPVPARKAWRSDVGVRSGKSREGRSMSRCPVDDELDTIVLKALSKEPNRRYQSPGEMARDVDRYLAGEPIEAKRDSAIYLVKKTFQRHRLLVTAMLSFVALVTVSAVVFWRLARAEKGARIEAVAQRDRADSAAKQAARALRGSWGSLIRARYGERNYEGVVETALRLKRRFGAEALASSGLTRQVMISTWQNNASGYWATGIARPRTILHGGRPGLVYIFTDEYLHLYDLAESAVVRRVPLPPSPGNTAPVHAGPKGSVWMGAGSVLYRFSPGDGEFNLVLDVREVGFARPDPGQVIEDSDGREEWVRSTARTLPITAVAVADDETGAALVLGDAVVCWADPDAPGPLRWWCGNKPSAKAVESLLDVSPDAKWILWKPGREEQLRLLSVDPLTSMSVVMNREIPIKAVRFDGDGARFHAVTARGMLVSPEMTACDEDRYAEAYDHRASQANRIVAASFDGDGRYFCAIGKDGELLVEPTVAGSGYSLRRRIISRPWRACRMDDEGNVLAVAEAGDLYRFDGRAFGTRLLPLTHRFIDVQPGRNEREFYAVVREVPDSTGATFARIDLGGGRPRVRTVGAQPDYVKTSSFRVDPAGRYLVGTHGRYGRITDLSTGRTVRTFLVSRYSVSVLRFSDDGRYFAYGGWNGDLVVLRTDDWSVVHGYDSAGWLYDCLIERTGPEGPCIVFCGEDTDTMTQRVESSSHRILWRTPATKGVPVRIIPSVSPGGERSYWVRNWWGDYTRLSAQDGRVVATEDRWREQSPEHETFTTDSDMVALLTHGGQVQLCLKENMRSIFDPRSVGLRGQRLAFGPDCSVLAVVGDGQIHLIETGRWRSNPLLRKNAEALLGPDLTAGVDWGDRNHGKRRPATSRASVAKTRPASRPTTHATTMEGPVDRRGAWVSTGPLSIPRAYHTATLLPDGRVLVAGGRIAAKDGGYTGLRSCELYDPITREWAATGSVTYPVPEEFPAPDAILLTDVPAEEKDTRMDFLDNHSRFYWTGRGGFWAGSQDAEQD